MQTSVEPLTMRTLITTFHALTVALAGVTLPAAAAQTGQPGRVTKPRFMPTVLDSRPTARNSVRTGQAGRQSNRRAVGQGEVEADRRNSAPTAAARSAGTANRRVRVRALRVFNGFLQPPLYAARRLRIRVLNDA